MDVWEILCRTLFPIGSAISFPRYNLFYSSFARIKNIDLLGNHEPSNNDGSQT